MNEKGSMPFQLRMLRNGHWDEYAYEAGRLDTTIPFDRLRGEPCAMAAIRLRRSIAFKATWLRRDASVAPRACGLDRAEA